MKKPQSLIRLFAAAAVILLFAVAVPVIVIDPFFRFHAPLKGFPYIVDNQIDQNPGMAMNMTYDSFITGSSMTVNFDTDDFTSFAGKTLKLSYDGAYPHNLAVIMDYVFDPGTRARRNNPVRAAIIGLDAYVFTAGVEETKFPLESYLYDDNPFNDIEYVLNKDVWLDYVAKPVLRGRGTDLSFVYGMDWITEDLTGEDYVLQQYVPAEKKDEEADPDLLIEGTEANLAANILPYVEAHPETEFYFFFPPYSILYWNNVLNEKMLNARLNQLRCIGNALLAYDNVRVFYFSNDADIIENFDNYTDYSHYLPSISHYIAECMADGRHEVKPGGMDAVLEQQRDVVLSYDFDALFARHEQGR